MINSLSAHYSIGVVASSHSTAYVTLTFSLIEFDGDADGVSSFCLS